MSNLICKENFNWQKYVERYKELKAINNLDTAWNHWCEEGRKQGRKFFTLAPFKNNKYYIITKEYIKQKNLKLQNKKSIVVSKLEDDVVIEDYISNIKHKLKKFNKNKIFVCQTVNKNIDDKINVKQKNNTKKIKPEINTHKYNTKKNDKQEINLEKSDSKNDDIEILEKDIKYTSKINDDKYTSKINDDKYTSKINDDKYTSKINDEKCISKINDEWTQKSENSEIFFIDFKNNKDNTDNSSESKKYFSKKNPVNLFSNST